MSEQTFIEQRHNPDVLSCISDLSNDEVFTPPELANQILDTLEQRWAKTNNGANIWANKTTTFLDPFTKSGVFLREIARRLTVGLAEEIPDLEERVNHILTNQVYGIAITQITSLLARRSLYCSKHANGPHSVVNSFDSTSGNIWFESTRHTWEGGRQKFVSHPLTGKEIKKFEDRKCKYCQAKEQEFERSADMESHAYAFIHTEDIKVEITEMFGENMQFDVIIGNPPYQLSDGGFGASAMPIYHKFIQQAQELEPRFISMVIPARWYSGGKGLDQFREMMLADRRIRHLTDFHDARDAFPGAGDGIAGGICYFLWDRDNTGPCLVETFAKEEKKKPVERDLNEFEIFIRDNQALHIIRKVLSFGEDNFSSIVSTRMPFGLRTYQESVLGGDLYMFSSRGDGKILRESITKNPEWIDRWKVLLSATSSEHAGQAGRDGKKKVLSRIEVMPPRSVCTESYLALGPFNTKKEATNVISYLQTKFLRFLVSTATLTQHVTRSGFNFSPIQDFTKSWTDEELYTKYGLNKEEIDFIESTIRPMDTNDG